MSLCGALMPCVQWWKVTFTQVQFGGTCSYLSISIWSSFILNLLKWAPPRPDTRLKCCLHNCACNNCNAIVWCILYNNITLHNMSTFDTFNTLRHFAHNIYVLSLKSNLECRTFTCKWVFSYYLLLLHNLTSPTTASVSILYCMSAAEVSII